MVRWKIFPVSAPVLSVGTILGDLALGLHQVEVDQVRVHGQLDTVRQLVHYTI